VKRKSAPFTMKPPENKKRKATARDTGLSKRQRPLLLWLLKQEEAIKDSGDKKRIVELNKKGIPWSPKRFYDDTYGQAMPQGQGSTVSRTLKELEDSGKKETPRRLVERYDSAGGVGKKPRTSHVKLTPEGRLAANFEREHGMTRRQHSRRERMSRQLEHYRYCLDEFQNAGKWAHEEFGPAEVRDPWDWEYTIDVGSRAFERAYRKLIKEIGKLTSALDLPLTEEERLLLEGFADDFVAAQE
jgi:DNA-binding MarR family transcriptional regulator